jgi:hypothetical protein
MAYIDGGRSGTFAGADRLAGVRKSRHTRRISGARDEYAPSGSPNYSKGCFPRTMPEFYLQTLRGAGWNMQTFPRAPQTPGGFAVRKLPSC